jgi:hypothetical protein
MRALRWAAFMEARVARRIDESSRWGAGVVTAPENTVVPLTGCYPLHHTPLMGCSRRCPIARPRHPKVGIPMPTLIEFVQDWFAEVEAAPGRLRQVAFRRGDRLRADIRRIGDEVGSAEVADLGLADGTTALHIPVSRFALIGGLKAAA